MKGSVDWSVVHRISATALVVCGSLISSAKGLADSHRPTTLPNDPHAFVCVAASEPTSTVDDESAVPRVCAPGEAPSPIARFATKGNLHLGQASRPKDGGNAGYYYSVALQVVTATSASADFTQHAPVVAPNEAHSLAELALISADSFDIVEIGWIVFAGDPQPQLFVYHWVDNNPTCYNGCGYVQLSTTRYPGMSVDVDGMPHNYSIAHQDGRWYLGYEGEWIGYFPDELWRGAFVEAAAIEWYGEVASENEQPCSQMGAGVFGDAPNAARISAQMVNGLPANAGFGDDNRPDWYSVGDATPDAFSFGGPGACNGTIRFNRIGGHYEPVLWPAK